jgi:tetratricopeptide (TPR) repeat protein
MTLTRRLIALSLAAILLSGTTALACGPFTLEAIFVHTVHPMYPLESFARGKIGVVQPSYARSYLYTAYRYLSGRNFTAAEQKALVELWKERIELSSNDNPEDWSKGWLEARKKVAGVQARDAIDVNRNREKPNEYEYFVNCNRDSFDTAAATLNQRIAKFGADSPAMQNWVAAQDAVFSNCSSGAAIPEPLPATDDAVLRADRAYQIAAANFYATNFDEARKHFEAIAADSASPWRRTAPYLVARTLVRKASLGPAEQKQESLAAAESQLAKILADKNKADQHAAATRLANLVRFRLHPVERTRELAKALLIEKPNDNLKQDLWDYTMLLDNVLDVDAPKPLPAAGVDDLTDWLTTLQSTEATSLDHALERLQATRSDPWLVAALSKVDAKHPKANDLLAQALNVKPAAAAFASARFHAVRLLMESGKNDEARTLLDQLLKTNRAQFDESSENLLRSKRMLLATDLNDFLTFAARVPAALSWNDDGREIPTGDEEVSGQTKASRNQPRFDYDAGNALNHQFPVTLLKEAAKSTVLPTPARRDLAQAAWLRAAILGDTKTADELVPVLSSLVPELAPLLNEYLSATTPEAKKFAAIFAWLRFPGLEPMVDIGVGREEPLNKQDTYRDNWWCGGAFNAAESERGEEEGATGPPSFTGETEQAPLFLTPAQRAAGAREAKILDGLGAGPNYIAKQVIQWATKNPADPRVPEALALAVTTTRYGCTDAETGRWSKAAFDLLHRKYPNTTWARKTKYWFKE